MNTLALLRRVLLALGLAFGLALVLFAWWWTHPADPETELRDHWSPLVKVERQARPEFGARIERWTLTDERGRTFTGLWRSAAGTVERPWTVVLLGGLGTGDRAALLIPDDIPAHVLAVDWPWTGAREMSVAEFAAQLPAIRSAILTTPTVLALGLDAVRDQPEVDDARIALLGVSLGVPPSVAAMRLTDSPRALALLDGAARIDLILQQDIRGWIDADWLSRPLAAVGYRLVMALEPLRNAEACADTPTLLINAENDERLPIESVRALHEALPHAESRWRSDIHVNPGRPEAIAELAVYVNGWLLTLETDADTPVTTQEAPGNP